MTRPIWRRALAPLATSILGVTIGYFVFASFTSTQTRLPSYRFSISAPPAPIRALSVSPDGRYVAFISNNADSANQIWLRDLETETYRAVDGTEGVGTATLFWSPDSKTVAFNVGSELMRVGVSGLPPEQILNIEALLPSFGQIQGGDWAADGTILLATQEGIVAIPPSGDPVSLTDTTGIDVAHSYPSILSDGHRFVYLATATGEVETSSNGIYLGAISPDDVNESANPVLRSNSPAIFVEDGVTRGESDGYLIYERDGQVLARSFDPDSRGLGDEFAVAETTPSSLEGLIARPYSAAATGTLVYVDSELAGESRLVWYDRSGNTVGQFEQPRIYRGVRFGAADDLIIVNIQLETGDQHGWYSELDVPRWTRVATGEALAFTAVVSATRRVAVSMPTGGGAIDIYGRHLGQASHTLWWASPYVKHVNNFSADGRYVVWDEHVAPGNQDLSMLEIDEDGSPVGEAVVVADTSADESFGQFSPNADWIVYDSNEEGPYEVFIKLVNTEARLMAETRGMKVSSQGGRKPRWSADGSELYYLAPGNTVMAVAVDTSDGQLTLGTPEALFEHPQVISFMPWDVSADGRFLLRRRPHRRPIQYTST